MAPLRCAVCALLAAPAIALPIPAVAQASDNETAEAQATILGTGSIIKLTDMNFGQIVKPAAPGAVVLTPSASPTCNTTGGLSQSGPCQAASFRGDLTWLFPLTITKPAGGQINLVGPGGATMLLDNFTIGGTTGLIGWFGSTPTVQSYLVLGGDGVFTFHVGGTLHVGANQPAGVYNGTFTLTFNYD